MEKIAIILTVHNRKTKTLFCLSNIQNEIMPKEINCDIYLTDDGCTDGTADAIRKLYPQVQIINGNGNLYWNRGMYKAWSEASKGDYDYYLWLNDDTYLYNGSIKKLISCSRLFENKKIIVGSTCSTTNKNEITYGGRCFKHGLIEPSLTPKKCDFFNGNIVLISRYVYSHVGFNDPIYRHALGDFDYGLRASKMGIESIIAPDIYGECDLHDNIPIWQNPQHSIKKRYKNFYSPTGSNPFEFFIYRKRHFGLLAAFATFITNFVHVTFPSIWSKRNSSIKHSVKIK